MGPNQNTVHELFSVVSDNAREYERICQTDAAEYLAVAHGKYFRPKLSSADIVMKNSFSRVFFKALFHISSFDIYSRYGNARFTWSIKVHKRAEM